MATAQKTLINTREGQKTLQTILKEVRRLQHQVWLLTLPEEDLEGYAHPERIKRSLKAALKEHPPRI